MKSQQPQHKKEANVGDLLVQTIKQNTIVKLAVWHRVIDETSKIVKMQRIKVNQNISYRCTVFDVGADIVLKLENQQSWQTKVFGPVKFDLSLSKQLSDHKNLHSSFNICIHSKSNSSTSAKIKTTVNQQGKLLLHLQAKNQPEIIFKIPLKTDWRNYEQFFDTHDMRLTDMIIKDIQPEKTFKQKLKSVNICARNSNSLQITFSNGSQRNIFLAQILKKTRDLSQTTKNSQFQTNQDFQHKIQNEIDDLFKSNMNSHYFDKNLYISDKIVGQMKNVVFTRNNSIQDDLGLSIQSFDNFINPENDYHKFPKLSEILQEQTQIQDKSTINNQKYYKGSQKKFQKLGSTKKIQQTQSKSSLHSYLSQQNNWNKLAVQNKVLSKQMDALKKQNLFLRKKLLNNDYKNKHFKIIQYQMPSELRNYYKKLNESQRKQSRERAYSQQQKITSARQKTCWTQQTSQVIHQNVPNKFFLSTHKKSPTESVVKQDKIKQSTKTITTSSKSVKQFPGIGSVGNLV